MIYSVIFFLAVLYHFIVYPAAMILSGFIFRQIRRVKPAVQHTFSIIVPVYNEEKNLENKVLNSLEILGLHDGEIIIVSDGSTDSTNDLLGRLKDRYPARITAVVRAERAGKASAVNIGISKARGDILLITDANVFLERDFFSQIGKVYAENDCDCVFGNLIYSPFSYSSLSDGEKIYWSWDKFLSQIETRSGKGSAMGITGSLLTVKKELNLRIPEDAVLDDLELLGMILENGKRALFCSRAVGYETPAVTTYDGIIRKERIISGLYHWLSRRDFRKIAPIDRMHLFSHKIIRWFLPLFFLLHICEQVRSRNTFFKRFYQVFFALPLAEAFIRFLVSRYRNKKDTKIKLFYLPFYVMCMVISFVIGTLRFFTGKSTVIWDVIER